MYPQINNQNQTFVNPPGSSQRINQSPFYGRVNSMDGADPSSSSSPRVQIAEPFRIAPPVPPPSAVSLAAQPSASGAAQPTATKFDYEKKILKGENGDVSTSGLLQTREDPYEATLAQFISQGISREEAALALMILGPQSNPSRDDVRRVAADLRQLKSMGFPATMAAGALIAHKGNLDDAANTCLNAQ